MNKTRVLLVMKPTAFRDELMVGMGHEGFEVVLASEGLEALDILRKYSVNEILTQLDLPQVDGLELILNIRNLQITVPIIVVSFKDSEIKDEVLKAGASEFLHYPVDPATVIDLIKHNARLKNEIKTNR